VRHLTVRQLIRADDSTVCSEVSTTGSPLLESGQHDGPEEAPTET